MTPEAIEEAARQLAAHLPPTPLQYSDAFAAKAGCHVHLKIEAIQPGRSFKVRGAMNKIIRLSPEARAAGVITASAGNHGQGVAYSARAFGIPATVFVPEQANPMKVQAMKRMGAKVIHHGANYEDAFDEATRVQRESGAAFVHAYNDPDVIAGQGSIAVELLDQLPEFDTILVPVGGGGLISGISTYLKARRPAVTVIGVEPAGADALTRSLAAGHVVRLERVNTMADGLAASAPGELTFEIARRNVDSMVVVRESEMLRAIRLFFEWEHLLAEPSGAAALAALLYHHNPKPGERVVVVLSGANVTGEVMVEALNTR